MDWHPVISVQQQTLDNDFWHFSISNVRFAFWAFFKNRKKLGSHTGSKWWFGDPVTRTWTMTQMIHWPGDPMTQFHVWSRSVEPSAGLTGVRNKETHRMECVACYAFHATHAMRAKIESVDKLTTETTHAIVPCNVTHGQQSTRQLAAWQVVSRDLRHSRRPQAPRLSQSLAFLTHSPYIWLLGTGSARLRPMFAIITPALVGVRTASCLWDKRSRGTTLYEPYAVL